MRHFLLRVFILSIFLTFGASQAYHSSAQVGEPWQLIAEVNALRASYGLPAYEVDNALMTAAQSHSEYQASINTWTHSGPGGSRPHDRAVAAGYGGGAQVYVSENVATGVDLSPSTTVYQMWQDAVHLETMISSDYRNIGAGVAEADGWVYYTIDVGYVAGNPGDGLPPTGVPTLPGGTPAPTAIALVPITIATSRPDGAIIHVVQYGQFLENIAQAYSVSLQELLEKNYLNQDTVIFPGDKLLIKPSTTPNGSATGNATLTQASSDTPEGTLARTPTRTPTAQSKRPTTTPSPKDGTPVALAAAVEPLDPSDTAPGEVLVAPVVETHQGPDYLLIIVLVLAVIGGGLIALGSAVKRAA